MKRKTQTDTDRKQTEAEECGKAEAQFTFQKFEHSTKNTD